MKMMSIKSLLEMMTLQREWKVRITGIRYHFISMLLSVPAQCQNLCLFFLLTATFVIALPLLLFGNEPSEFSFTFAESFYLKHWRVCVMFLGSLYHILLDFVNFTLRTLWSTGWITEYHKSRPGLNLLQQRIDDYITAHEAQLEQVICPLEQWLNLTLSRTFSIIMMFCLWNWFHEFWLCVWELYFLLGWNVPK